MGFNAVRLHIYWEHFQPTSPNSVNTAAFTQTTEPLGTSLDNIVNWCAQNNMYVILNPSWSSGHHRALMGNNAQRRHRSNIRRRRSPNKHAQQRQVQSGINYLYNWIAQRYATNSNVIFESFNELLDEHPASSADITAFATFNDGWVSATESGEGTNSHVKIIQLLYDWSSWNYVL